MESLWERAGRIKPGMAKKGGGMEIIVNDGNFKAEVLDSSQAVIVDFWAEWCGPCRMLAPTIGEIAEEYEGKMKVCKLDVDTGPQTSKNYEVMNIPTILFFKDGKVVDKIVGLASKNDIVSKITRYI